MLSIKDLIDFSKTYQGFTFLYLKNTGMYMDIKFNQRYPYIVSFKTLIEIKYINSDKYIITVYNDSFEYVDKIKNDEVIIGGWFDKTNNIYYIEVNISCTKLNDAIILAKLFKQKYAYNNIKGECIDV